MFSSDTATVRHSATTVPCPKYPYAYVCVFSSDTATLRHHPLLYMVSLFSPARLRDYDSMTPPLTLYGKSIFLQRHYDSTTSPLTTYSKSVFSSDTTTVQRHPLLYMVSLFFSSNTVTLRQYDTTLYYKI